MWDGDCRQSWMRHPTEFSRCWVTANWPRVRTGKPPWPHRTTNSTILTAILDHNTLQITGHTRDVCSNEPLDEKFASFGWDVRTVDGHDFAELTEALTSKPQVGKPTMIIANTVKGRGVSFMENVVSWHHGVPSDEQYELAQSELAAAEQALMSEAR